MQYVVSTITEISGSIKNKDTKGLLALCAPFLSHSGGGREEILKRKGKEEGGISREKGEGERT